MFFIRLAVESNFHQQTSTPLCRTLLAHALIGSLCGWIGLQLYNLSALAVEASSTQSIETLKASRSVNGVLCIAACNDFFEAGQSSFELEIQRLQNRAARLEESSPLLQVDPGLLKTLEEEREVESRQNL